MCAAAFWFPPPVTFVKSYFFPALQCPTYFLDNLRGQPVIHSCCSQPRQAIKKRREARSHLFVQIGTIISGTRRIFNPQFKNSLQQELFKMQGDAQTVPCYNVIHHLQHIQHYCRPFYLCHAYA